MHIRDSVDVRTDKSQVTEIGERYRAYINKSIHHSYEYIIDLFIHIIFLICFLSPLVLWPQQASTISSLLATGFLQARVETKGKVRPPSSLSPSSSPLAWLGLLPNRRKARTQNPLLPPPFHAISLQLASFLIRLLSFWFWLLHRHMYASLLLRSSIHTCISIYIVLIITS